MSHFWFHCRSPPGPLAMSFVTLAYFYDFFAFSVHHFQTFLGSVWCPKSHKTATQRAKNVCFSASVSSQTEAGKVILGPFITLCLVTFKAFGDTQAVKTAQIGLTTG